MRPPGCARLPLALALALALAPSACGPPLDDDAADAQQEEDAAGDVLKAEAWVPAGRLIRLQLQRAAVPPPAGRPPALVYLPRAFDAAAPLSVVVYLHGWRNCVENIVRPVGGPCTPGGAARTGFNLAGQVEASGKNVLLLLPELAFDQASSTAGRLEAPGFFRALLEEALLRLRPVLGPRALADVERLVVATHSGGYNAAAAIVARGGLPVAEVLLLDSLYGRQDDIRDWMEDGRADLASLPWSGRRRILSVYTAGGGTMANNQGLATEVSRWDLGDAFVDDRTTATWDWARYRRGVLFKRSALSHDGTARYYFQRFLATSPIRPTPPGS